MTRLEEKVDLGIPVESKVCRCGKDMQYIEEAHTELDRVAYEPGYWECPYCGRVYSGGRTVGWNYNADMYWDDEDEM